MQTMDKGTTLKRTRYVTSEELRSQGSSIRRDGAISVAPATAKVDPVTSRRVRDRGLAMIAEARAAGSQARRR